MGKGFISRVDLAGNMLEREWVTGGCMPREAMGMVNRRLYVSDIDRLVEIRRKFRPDSCLLRH